MLAERQSKPRLLVFLVSYIPLAPGLRSIEPCDAKRLRLHSFRIAGIYSKHWRRAALILDASD